MYLWAAAEKPLVPELYATIRLNVTSNLLSKSLNMSTYDVNHKSEGSDFIVQRHLQDSDHVGLLLCKVWYVN